MHYVLLQLWNQETNIVNEPGTSTFCSMKSCAIISFDTWFKFRVKFDVWLLWSNLNSKQFKRTDQMEGYDSTRLSSPLCSSRNIFHGFTRVNLSLGREERH